MLLEQSCDKPSPGNDPSPFFAVMNLLARPSMDERDQVALRNLVNAKTWSPIPLPSLHQEILPLARANAEHAGIPFGTIFTQGESGTPPIPVGSDCIKSFLARQMHLSSLAKAFREIGLSRVVPIKGAAVSLRMDSPPLRLMCDIDLLIPMTDLEKAASAMKQAGWSRCSERSLGFRHQSGWQVDLQAPVRPLGEAILWAGSEGAEQPYYHAPVEYQVAFLAIHCFQGHGEKIWRDVADYRALRFAGDWDEDRWNHARNLAKKSNHLQVVDAFVHFCESLESSNPGVGSCASAELAPYVKLLHDMAHEKTSEISFHLLRQVKRPVREILRSLISIQSRRNKGRAVAAGDPQPLRGLYDIPRNRRLLMGCGFVLGQVYSSRIRQLHRLATAQKFCAVDSLFSSPGGRLPHGSSTSH
ncbi:MAG: nucleotidyltransferase family protein [Candidatus Sumerlaeia bacterium]|nr:nucleotidyltransferase family protein [Candidatus Sumerlaeia bacterium]